MQMDSVALILSLICGVADIDISLPPYNVVADGSADCTEALQAAADSAQIRQVTDETGYVLAQTVPTIRLPSGTYRISGPITFQSMAAIVGDNAVIVQTQNTDSFAFPCGTHVDVTGCTFVGGMRAIYIANENINTCMFNVKRCEFREIDTTAILLKSTATADFSVGVLSATLNIDECSFANCYQVLDQCCDFANFNKCQVSYSPTSRKLPLTESGYQAVFIVRRGRFHMKDCTLKSVKATYSSSTSSTPQCWIYTTGTVILSETGIADAGDARPTIVYGLSGVDPANNNGHSIRMIGCSLADTVTSANLSSASIVLVGMPSQIHISNCSLKVVAPHISDPKGTAVTAADRMKILPKVYFGANTDYPNTIRIPSTLTKYLVK